MLFNNTFYILLCNSYKLIVLSLILYNDALLFNNTAYNIVNPILND